MFGNTKEQIESLTKEMSDISLERDKLISHLEEARNIIESADSEKKALSKKNSEYKKEIEVLKVQHKIDLDHKEKSIYHKVNTTLASMGVDTFANEYFSDNKPITDIEIINTFNSLTGHEKTEFYNKNKAAITRALLNTPSK